MIHAIRFPKAIHALVVLVALSLPATAQFEQPFSAFSSGTVTVQSRPTASSYSYYVFQDPAVQAPFQLMRHQWSWDQGMQVRESGGRVIDGWPTLNLILVFSKRPDASTLLDRVAVQFLPRYRYSGSQQTLRQLRATIERIEPNTAGGTNGHYPWIVHAKFPNGSLAGRSSTPAAIHVLGLATDASVQPVRTLTTSVTAWIPAAPATTLRITATEHREELPARTHMVLSWTFNRQVPGLYDFAIYRIVNGYQFQYFHSGTSGLQVVASERLPAGEWRHTIRLPKPTAGRWIVRIRAVSPNYNGTYTTIRDSIQSASLEHLSTLEVSLDERRQNTTSNGGDGFGSDIHSWLRAKLDFQTSEVSFNTGFELYGKVFGHRFKALGTEIQAWHDPRRNPTAGFRAVFTAIGITFPEITGGLPYTHQRTLARITIFRLSYSFMAGPIPVVVGAEASIGIHLSLSVGGNLNLDRGGIIQNLQATVALSGELQGQVFAGVGISFLGVEVSVTLYVELTLLGLNVPVSVFISPNGSSSTVDLIAYQAIEVGVRVYVHIPLPLIPITIDKRFVIVRLQWGPPRMNLMRIAG